MLFCSAFELTLRACQWTDISFYDLSPCFWILHPFQELCHCHKEDVRPRCKFVHKAYHSCSKIKYYNRDNSNSLPRSTSGWSVLFPHPSCTHPPVSKANLQRYHCSLSRSNWKSSTFRREKIHFQNLIGGILFYYLLIININGCIYYPVGTICLSSTNYVPSSPSTLDVLRTSTWDLIWTLFLWDVSGRLGTSNL